MIIFPARFSLWCYLIAFQAPHHAEGQAPVLRTIIAAWRPVSTRAPTIAISGGADLEISTVGNVGQKQPSVESLYIQTIYIIVTTMVF